MINLFFFTVNGFKAFGLNLHHNFDVFASQLAENPTLIRMLARTRWDRPSSIINFGFWQRLFLINNNYFPLGQTYTVKR